MKSEEQTRTLFGISLSERPRWQQFLICCSGFFFGYLVNGVCEEYVYNGLQFSYGWYFTFVQGWVYILFDLSARIHHQANGESMEDLCEALCRAYGFEWTYTITTARKAVTVLLSYMIFTKPLTEQHGSGLLLIAMGIVSKMLPDYNKPSMERATSSSHAKIENLPPREDGGFHTGIQEDEEKRPWFEI